MSRKYQMFSPGGRLEIRVSKSRADELVNEGLAYWVDAGWGKQVLRRVAEIHGTAAALRGSDVLANVGIGTPEEVRMARLRIAEHSPYPKRQDAHRGKRQASHN
jgi:hypothetical protein